MSINYNLTGLRQVCLGLMLAGLASTLHAQTTVTVNQMDNDVIPDNNPNGIAETVNVSAPFTSISDVQVSLNISAGSYDGDYYAYLTDGTGFAVLLNRVGSTVGNAFGSPDSGFNVTFSDSAANGDIHQENFAGGVVTGAWQPDGRDTDPLTTLDTDPRTAFLSSFDGLNPNGDWYLFIADLSPGGQGSLVDWSLTVTGSSVSVPDEGCTTLLLLIGASALGIWSRSRRHLASCRSN